MRNPIAKKESPLAKLYLMPRIFKMLFAFFIFFGLSIAGFMFLHMRSLVELREVSLKKVQLESEISQGITSKGQIVYLSKDTEIEKAEYEKTLKDFPPASKVNDLLADITKLGTSYGLKFLYFKPEAAVSREYYAGIPVNISVVGKFHQLGNFLSGIANLPGTVVVVNPFTISRDAKGSNLLTLQFTATIYHTLTTSSDIKA
jgi:type IV pilus assembly protein PilO